MSRGFLAALTAACVAFALVDSAQAEPTTIKGSKSTQADRMGGGGGHGQTKKVKSIKSNRSDRMGGGGGHNPAKVINLDSRPGSNY
jgi:hypothetical protein